MPADPLTQSLPAQEPPTSAPSGRTRAMPEVPRPLRVLFLATFFPKPGREIMGVWALKQISALKRQGADVEVVSMTSWIPRFFAPWLGRYRAWAECPAEYWFGEVHVRYPRWLFYNVGRLARMSFRKPALQHAIAWWSGRRGLLRAIRDFRPDVIFAHHTGMSGHLAYRLNRALGIPYVVADHDFDEIAGCVELPARRRFFEKVVRNAACLVPVAKRMQASLEELFPDVRVVPITNGADPPPPHLAHIRPPGLQGKTVVLCVAMFYARKGIPLLIRAFDRIAELHPDALLRIIGDGPDRAAIEQAIAQAAHKDHISLLGSQPHDRVLQEMAWADIFALVGWDEPCATVYLESLAAGLPILCCNDGGINDVLVNEVHGLTIPPRDETAAAEGLDRLLGDSALRTRMGGSARELFQQGLSWDAYARKLLAILEDAAGRKSPAAGR
ncbi:MAG TPA: glycosyltransferase [Tepidisphaeraceae bacterium]|jgi:glycosyltransferase involved in cell wall biosynthesis|nr:glycosyltransferase [Tepidisphaeraceae bacterium]